MGHRRKHGQCDGVDIAPEGKGKREERTGFKLKILTNPLCFHLLSTQAHSITLSTGKGSASPGL